MFPISNTKRLRNMKVIKLIICKQGKKKNLKRKKNFSTSVQWRPLLKYHLRDSRLPENLYRARKVPPFPFSRRWSRREFRISDDRNGSRLPHDRRLRITSSVSHKHPLK